MPSEEESATIALKRRMEEVEGLCRGDAVWTFGTFDVKDVFLQSLNTEK